MTKQELITVLDELIKSLPDTPVEGAATTSTNSGEEPENNPAPSEDKETPAADEGSKNKKDNTGTINKNDELEEGKGIEPQTNGKITDNIPQQPVETETITETKGVEEVLAANFDQRLATMLKQYTELKSEIDKINVVLAELMTRIELVQDVTDSFTPVDHNSILADSIKHLV